MDKESFMLEGAAQMHEQTLPLSLGKGNVIEKCGICCSPVTSRGVLDCCSHVFCFSCIDCWSAITNICPLCKLQFKFITFLPAAGNEESNEVDTHGDFLDIFGKGREECWNDGSEEDGALSFPSYFIDEDAVVCLDGDGCQVRAGLAADAAESGIEDTSVACDSCDCWYHAICVGYKPESQNQRLWLCPRCAGTGILDLFGSHSNIQAEQLPSVKSSSSISASTKQTPVGSAITFVEEGETAVVVSMAAADVLLSDIGNSLSLATSLHSTESIRETSVCELEVNKNSSLPRVGSPSSSGLSVKPLSKTVSNESLFDTKVEEPTFGFINDIATDMNHERVNEKLEVSQLACSSHLQLTCTSDAGSVPSISTPLPKVESPFSPIGITNQLPESASSEPTSRNIQKVAIADVTLDDTFDLKHEMATNLEQGSPTEKHAVNIDDREDKSNAKKESQHQDPKHEVNTGHKQDKASPKTDGLSLDCDKHLKCTKRKLKSEDREYLMTTDSQSQPKILRNSLSGKIPREYKSPETRLAGEQTQDNLVQHDGNGVLHNNCPELKLDALVTHKTEVDLDELKEVVEGPDLKIVRDPTHHIGASAKGGRVTNDGIRTRIIVHRRSDLGGKTSVIVDNVRKHLRDAVGPGASSNLGKIDVTDERFFAAFKAAVVNSEFGKRRQMAPNQRTTQNKDGVRHNLTRKLYGGSGKRRKAWDRDWDVSFWKERAVKEKKARHQAENTDSMDIAELEKAIRDSKKIDKSEDNSILNRIYLADTSLCPRQSDIKPLAAQLSCKGSSMPVQKTEDSSHTKSVKEVTNVVNKSVKKSHNGSSLVSAAVSKTPDSKMIDPCKPFTESHQNLKTDKRKWALEVLARKTGQLAKDSVSKGVRSVHEEGFPLLAELPVHMRPVLEYDGRSKVPTATRQVHLDRFVEYYLQKASLESMKESPECKAAILTAVSKENSIYDRANTKGVYLNLCVQALSLSSIVEKEASVTTEVTNEAAETSPIEAAALVQNEDSAVIMALKATGLISDSPPGSPHNEDAQNNSYGNGSIFDHHNDPSLDIYGDFESNLDSIEATEVDPSSDQKKLSINGSCGDPAAPKVKVILTSTAEEKSFQPVSSNSVLICEDLEGTERESSGSEMSATVEAFKIVGNNGNERDAGDALISREDEISLMVNQRKEPMEGQESMLCFESKNVFKESTSLKLASRERKVETRNSPDKASGACDISMDSSMFDFHTQTLIEGFEQYGSMLAPMALEEEVVEEVAEPYPSAGNTCVLAKGTSISVVKVENETLNEAPQKSEKMEAVCKQVEKYVKEHIRPLHASHVITTEQYKWAVAKTTNKVMQHHTAATSADFLISEGEKVKKLAEQYLQFFKQQKI